MQNLQIEFIVDSEPVDQVSLQISDDQLQTLKQGIQPQASPTKKRRGRPPAKPKVKTPTQDQADNNQNNDFEKPYQREYDAQIRKEFKKANFDKSASGLASAKNLDEHSSDEDDDEIDNKSDDDEFLKGLEK